jgi:predicted transcriptional regulator
VNAEIQTYRLNHSGLKRVFGELEAAIMERVWEREQTTIGKVHQDLTGEREVAFNTVMTVMNRLVEKGFLYKERRGRSHLYFPVQDRHSFMQEVSKTVAKGLIRDFSDYAVSQFASALAETDPEKLEELEQILAAWKAERN